MAAIVADMALSVRVGPTTYIVYPAAPLVAAVRVKPTVAVDAPVELVAHLPLAVVKVPKAKELALRVKLNVGLTVAVRVT